VATTSTGFALLFSKLIPYAFAVRLSVWTLFHGEHEKKEAERLAAGSGRPYTLIRCLAR
jgi:hypothetical protein